MKPGWEVVKVGDVCELNTGGTPSRAKPEYFEGGEIKWLVSGDVHQKEIFDCEGRITKEGMNNSNARYLPINSIVIALNGQGKTRGTVAILRTMATCNQSVVSINPNSHSQLLPEYLYFNLHGRYKEIRHITGDAGNERRGLNMPLLRQISIPLPPLEEQQRIVAILNQALEGLNRSRANAEANLQNARDLFEASVSACLKNAEDNTDNRLKLGDIASFRNGLNFSQSSKGQVVKIVGVGDFKDNFYVPVDDLSEITLDGTLQQEDQLQAGDLVAVRSNGNKALIGRTMVVPYLSELAAFSGFTIRIRLNTDELLPEYLCEQMKTKAMRERMSASGGGSNISNLNQKMLAELPILVPELTVQTSTLSQLEKIRSDLNILLSSYRSKLQDLDDLRQSLLHKAFAGELT
ncbi:restriction endonuclease subunit S [Asticcacaulis sp. ZE23SCel15]|uniref:restriction endonuclease subunit S n=1 Tax=Asticcacaulis sp. ZE23SCel15 TaxID=3059027 RepID=UPI00265FCEC9|nr:restriction endonuclease subunit S [Asticcacaulis sp. ZE23SCel15]WKL58000.1 restriction endonuclease subunit S [Asticcacaulis sp. ZE23SCel15]